MTLQERIIEDMKAAMRAKDSVRLTTIRMLTAAMKQKEVDERVVLTDADVLAIVDKLVKQRRDSVAAFEKAARTDLVDKEKAEIELLSAYLPRALSEVASIRYCPPAGARDRSLVGDEPRPASQRGGSGSCGPAL